MRGDMAKVVTERPRRGHAEKSKKTTGRPIRRYDPDAAADQPRPSVRLECEGILRPDQPAEAVSALLHRQAVEQGARRALAEARSAQRVRFAHLGSRDVGNRDPLLHRAGWSGVQQQPKISPLGFAHCRFVRASEDGTGPGANASLRSTIRTADGDNIG